MKFKRRELLKLAALHSAVASIPFKAKADMQFPRIDEVSVLQGATDETSTQFSFVYRADRDLVFAVVDARGASYQPDEVSYHHPAGSPYKLARAAFSNLVGVPGEDLFALMVIDNSNGSFIDVRRFKTLNLNKPDLTFAMCSCMDDGLHTPGIWRDLVSREPDMIFFLGDTVYCDKESTVAHANAHPSKLYRRFSESRLILDIYFSKRLIPIIAVWDDHDFAQNDTGSNFPFVKESQENFLSFFAQEPRYCRGLERGPGISSALVIADQQIILLDDRSFRQHQGSHDIFAHWGQEQENWFLSRVNEHQGVTWLFNGSQFFPQMIFKESVSGDHPVNFDSLLRKLRASGKKIVFGSGDVHFSEISEIESEQLGYRTYELTSSSIHSYKWPGIPEIIWNHRRILSTGNRNYLLVKSQAQGDGVKALVESRSENNTLNFNFTFEL